MDYIIITFSFFLLIFKLNILFLFFQITKLFFSLAVFFFLNLVSDLYIFYIHYTKAISTQLKNVTQCVLEFPSLYSILKS